MGTIGPQPLETFLDQVKTLLQCQGIRYVNAGKQVSRVAVGGGACASELAEAASAGCDTFVTSDVKYNQFFDAKSMGINLIDAGHYQTENPIMRLLAQKLKDAFPEIQIVISQEHQDCMKFY
jgi:putative NIF3 family GTP cyclohydrolase 1 type 2